MVLQAELLRLLYAKLRTYERGAYGEKGMHGIGEIRMIPLFFFLAATPPRSTGVVLIYSCTLLYVQFSLSSQTKLSKTLWLEGLIQCIFIPK